MQMLVFWIPALYSILVSCQSSSETLAHGQTATRRNILDRDQETMCIAFMFWCGFLSYIGRRNMHSRLMENALQINTLGTSSSLNETNYRQINKRQFCNCLFWNSAVCRPTDIKKCDTYRDRNRLTKRQADEVTKRTKQDLTSIITFW
jgi:hypothetical protein